MFYLQSCLIVFFFDGSSQERALKFIDEMTNSHVSNFYIPILSILSLHSLCQYNVLFTVEYVNNNICHMLRFGSEYPSRGDPPIWH
jgi:hypothetical protein